MKHSPATGPLRPPVSSGGWLAFPYLCALALSLVGLIALYSASQNGFSASSQVLGRQTIWLVLALGVSLTLARLELDRLRGLALPGWLLAVALLVLLLVPGVAREVNGARRWLEFGPVNVQVSDFAKVALLYFLAHYLARHQRALRHPVRGGLLPLAVIGVTAGLIFLEPDFGTAVLVGGVGFTLLFLAGVPILYLVPPVVLAATGFVLAVLADPVRLRRVTAFLDVDANRGDGAYQLWQGMVGFGAGGMTGVGVGNGRQQHAFLPEAHTDFIFPVIGEELGLAATLGIVLIFSILFLVAVLRLRRSPDLFAFLIGIGALLLIAVQAIINIAVTTGSMPTKGISLPFISYGGSNLVATFILIAFLAYSLRRAEEPARLRVREL